MKWNFKQVLPYVALAGVAIIPSLLLGTVPENPNDTVFTIAMQEDGKAVIGGQFTDNHIMRKNADGTLDEAFSSGWTAGGFNANVNAIALQPDQKILVGGEFTRFDMSLAGSIARLNPDGSLDTDFSLATGVGFDDAVNSIDVESDGKIWVGGRFHTFNGVNVGPVVRLNVDGTLDTTAQIGNDLDNAVQTVIAGSNGKANMIGGNFSSYFKAFDSQ